jgi:hypothetical protein
MANSLRGVHQIIGQRLSMSLPIIITTMTLPPVVKLRRYLEDSMTI